MFSISDSGRPSRDDDAPVGIKSSDASAASVVGALLTTMFLPFRFGRVGVLKVHDVKFGEFLNSAPRRL